MANEVNELGLLVRKTEIGAQKKMGLAQFPCIREVNAIHPTFTQELGLPIRPIGVGAQKIDGTTLDTYGVINAVFSMTDKTNRVRFFKKTFLVANVSPEVVFDIPFLTLSGADVDSYTLNGVRV